MQTRSADEPMTTFVTCVNCQNKWKCECQRSSSQHQQVLWQQVQQLLYTLFLLRLRV